MCDTMVMLNFTKFRTKIEKGEKRQTIRKYTGRPPKVGDIIDLYWVLRRNVKVRMRTETCKEVLIKEYREFCDDEDIARRDGFNNATEMKAFLEYIYHPRPADKFVIIRW